MKFLFLCAIFLVNIIQSLAQNIEEELEFKFANSVASNMILTYQDLKLLIDQMGGRTKSKTRPWYMYLYKNGKKADSLILPNGKESATLMRSGIVANEKEIYFVTYQPQRILKAEIATGRLSVSAIIDGTTVIHGAVNNDAFILQEKYVLFAFRPTTQQKKIIFDFNVVADAEMKQDIAEGHPVGISSSGIFAFNYSGKILVKTGYNEADATFDCVYYVVNYLDGKIDKLRWSHFAPLLETPKKILSKKPSVRADSLNVDIRKFYHDTFESVGFVEYDFVYKQEVDEVRLRTETIEQDLFLVDQDFNLIGRALRRNFNTSYSIFDREKGALITRARTDSGRNCTYKFQLKHQLEKSFYDIYYDRVLSQQTLKGLSKNDKSLLRNFIFAKHNYRFKSHFYQAYFNGFLFYNTDAKIRTRLSNVDKLLTASDKSNIALLGQ
jgi:hypothetical protein